jgi:hypothetical protein
MNKSDDPAVGLPAMDDATKSSSEKTGMNDEPIPAQLELSSNIIDTSSQSSPVNEDQSTPLEERVQALEVKLATLSLLLSQQKIRRVSPLPITPPQSPQASDGTPSHPALESPAPLRPSPLTDRKRNFSFQILHGDSTPTETIESNETAIYLPQTLRPKTRRSGPERIAAFLNHQIPSIVNEEETTNIIEVENTTPKNGVKRDIKNKWLEYLNIFQESNYDVDESNYDVDLQMEEFVKIPGAVEALLGFGFWICVDSFLYILTDLPIRFLWSLLLLMRYMFIWVLQREVPEGPFRFHRRYAVEMI